MWAWGTGPLGDGTPAGKVVPVRIGNDTNWTFISSSLYGGATYGLQSDGALWFWGSKQLSPVKFGADKWTFVSSSTRHFHGIKSDGTLWAWGDNSEKSFGDGTNISSAVPVQIGTDNNWVEVSNSDKHTIARKTDGTLWGWCSNNKYGGKNEYGELGLGNTKAVYIPTKISEFTTTKVVKISTRNHGSQIIDSDGNRWEWGGTMDNGLKYSDGKLNLVPKKDEAKWKSICSNTTMSIAIKSDNSLWGWGYPMESKPLESKSQIGKEYDWIKIAAGDAHLLAINSKGELYTWGSNVAGQLGIGSREKSDGFSLPLSSNPLEIRNKAIALKELMKASIVLDNIKFDSIMSTKSKWDIGGTYNLTQTDGCIKEIQNYKLIISNDLGAKGSHLYRIEQVDGGTGIVDFYEIEDATYDNYKNRLYAKQTEKGGGSRNNYGLGIENHGLMFKIGEKYCLMQDLSIKGGIAKTTIHYEEYDEAAINKWKFINCTFEGKVILNK